MFTRASWHEAEEARSSHCEYATVVVSKGGRGE
jgi:hypothetical protein